MQAGNTFVGLYGLGEKAVLGESELTQKQNAENEKAKVQGKEAKHKALPVVRFEGRRTGFILQTADTDTFKNMDAFAAVLRPPTWGVAATLGGEREVRYTTLEGKTVRMQYQPGKNAAAVTIDGERLSYEDWPIYSGPYIRHMYSVLSVNDGNEGFVVDFTGDLPVYRAWRRQKGE